MENTTLGSGIKLTFKRDLLCSSRKSILSMTRTYTRTKPRSEGIHHKRLHSHWVPHQSWVPHQHRWSRATPVDPSCLRHQERKQQRHVIDSFPIYDMVDMLEELRRQQYNSGKPPILSCHIVSRNHSYCCRMCLRSSLPYRSRTLFRYTRYCRGHSLIFRQHRQLLAPRSCCCIIPTVLRGNPVCPVVAMTNTCDPVVAICRWADGATKST
jgi:hypothetical protein